MNYIGLSGGYMNVAEKLKLCRKNKGMTQEQLAKQLYVSRKTISSWENGRNYPDINSLIKMSSIFNVSMDDLLRDDRMLEYYAERDKQATKSHRIERYSYYLGIILLFLSYIELFRVEGFHTVIVPILLVVSMVILTIHYSDWQRFNVKKTAMMIATFAIAIIINGIAMGLSPTFRLTITPANLAKMLGGFAGDLLMTIVLSVSLTLLIFLQPKRHLD
ncbi:helix-turn-helix domain-containing protein [Lentilactobacillus sp. SPB1-3]|uniref:Helix-turn-helix domain-containing protein n=1 Tax=Lentilactobacillus terminaliae TaxID=3003483 RepID=A0ACD5DET2_9LACO